MGSNVKMKDIADRLNTTVNTVSRALKDCKDISATMKNKVRETAVEMGYIPNTVASSLRNGKTNICGVVFDNLINPYYMIMTDYIQKELKDYEYDMMIFNFTNGIITYEELKNVLSRQVDAIITFIETAPDAYEVCKKNNIPMIIVGRENVQCEMDCVMTDDFKGGILATKRLIESGCRRLAYVGAEDKIECSNRRYKGFMEVAKQNNIYAIRKISDLSKTDLVRATKELIEEKVDGIFAFSDSIAFEVIKVITESGLDVPKDIKVVGFDYLHRELPFPYSLATISTDKEEVAKKTVQIIMSRINNLQTKTVNEVFDVEFIPGFSCTNKGR